MVDFESISDWREKDDDCRAGGKILFVALRDAPAKAGAKVTAEAGAKVTAKAGAKVTAGAHK